MRMELLLLLLLLLAGALAVPAVPLPPPLCLLEEDAALPRLLCFAPRRFAGSTFQLAAAGTGGVPVLTVSAEPDQHKAEFILDGTPRCYRCRYRSYNGSAWSEFSAEVAVNVSSDGGCQPPASTGTDRPLPTSIPLRQDRSWLLPVTVSAAGVVLLLLAAAAVVAWRGSSWCAGRGRGATARSFAMTPTAAVPA